MAEGLLEGVGFVQEVGCVVAAVEVVVAVALLALLVGLRLGRFRWWSQRRIGWLVVFPALLLDYMTRQPERVQACGREGTYLALVHWWGCLLVCWLFAMRLKMGRC